jgi:hypothetical protein
MAAYVPVVGGAAGGRVPAWFGVAGWLGACCAAGGRTPV